VCFVRHVGGIIRVLGTPVEMMRLHMSDYEEAIGEGGARQARDALCRQGGAR
jgi:hypothetical protein